MPTVWNMETNKWHQTGNCCKKAHGPRKKKACDPPDDPRYFRHCNICHHNRELVFFVSPVTLKLLSCCAEHKFPIVDLNAEPKPQVEEPNLPRRVTRSVKNRILEELKEEDFC